LQLYNNIADTVENCRLRAVFKCMPLLWVKGLDLLKSKRPAPPHMQVVTLALPHSTSIFPNRYGGIYYQRVHREIRSRKSRYKQQREVLSPKQLQNDDLTRKLTTKDE
jgi:hypothetical protein